MHNSPSFRYGLLAAVSLLVFVLSGLKTEAATIQKFYLHNATTSVSGTLPGATTLSSATPNVTAAGASSTRSMDATIGVSQVSQALTSLAQTALQKHWFRRFMSPPLAAQTLPTGTWNLQLGASESNANANESFGWSTIVKVWRPSNGTTVATILDAPAANPSATASINEPGTTETNISTTSPSIAGVVIQDGDVLVLEIWAHAVQGNTTARTDTIFYDGTTEGSITSNAAFLNAPGAITLQAGTLDQSGYRWFRNADSPDLISITSNPSTSTDVVNSLASDDNNDVLYAVGSDRLPGDKEWRIERRNAKTSLLYYATTSNPSVGGDVANGVWFDHGANRLYVVGFDSNGATSEWRIEQRKAKSGTLLYDVTSDPSSGTDEANAVAVDSAGNYMYVVGTDSIPGDQEWRVEKRNTSDGSLVYAQTQNYSTSTDNPNAIVLDETNGYMYVAGQSATASGDVQWQFEKRSLSDGSLVFATSTNYSSGVDFAIGIGMSTSTVYAVGKDSIPGNNQWRIEARNLDGSLAATTSSNPTTGADTAKAIVAQSNGTMYVAGEEGSYWRIEKRDTDLSFKTAFGVNGVVTTTPSGGNNSVQGIALDNGDNRLFVGGTDFLVSGSDEEWRIERRDTNDGTPQWLSPLGNKNTSTTAPTHRTSFRLRELMHPSNQGLTTSTQFKLQYAQRSGDCDTAFSGETYADVSATTGTIQFLSNPGVTNGALIVATSKDPTHNADAISPQSYVDNGNFSALSTVAAGTDGMWDFSLQNYSAPAGVSYCFRVVKSDDSLLDSYSFIPEILTGASISSASDQVWEYGQSTTTASAITITASNGSVNSASNMRISINSAEADMNWDTSITAPSFSGTASAKVASTVSYPDSKTLFMDVTSNFSSGETLIINGLKFGGFVDVNAAYPVIELHLDGSTTSTGADVDDKTVAIKGKLTEADYNEGQQGVNQFESEGVTVAGVPLFRFVVNPIGEEIDISTTTITIDSYSGFTSSDITNTKLFMDLNGNGLVDGNEPQLGGGGAVNLGDTKGSIIFSGAWSATTSRGIILQSDVSSIDAGDFIRFSMPTASAAFGAKGKISFQSVSANGTVTIKNHAKANTRYSGGTFDMPSSGGVNSGGGAGGGGSEPPPDSGGGSEGGGGAGGGGGGGAPFTLCSFFPRLPFCKLFKF